MSDIFNLNSYDYFLPKELIAQNACHPQDSCKLLYFNNNKILDLSFSDIFDLLTKDDVLFFNNSKVIKARIKGNIVRGEKNIFSIDENGQTEIFYLKSLGNNKFTALVKPGKKFKKNDKIFLETNLGKYILEVLDFAKQGRIFKLHGEEDILDLLDKIGIMPLPPYIDYEKQKEEDYQTVFAKNSGSVAAPTASLHFTNELLDKLKNKGVEFLYSSLHVGEGTFKNVDTQNIKDYNIHSEVIEFPLDIFQMIENLKKLGKKIVSVGTTSTRILESLPYVYKKINLKNTFWDEICKNISTADGDKFIQTDIIVDNETVKFETRLFIYPGFKFNIVDKLITNFHLPKSSLLMLVSSFMGYENMKNVYKHAISNNYRFFSFGDAMMIENKISI